MDWIKGIAPTLGAALAGPLGGAAVSFLADKLGIEKKTVEAVNLAITSNSLSAEQISAVRMAEIEFQKFLKENEIDLAKLHTENTKSARDMQVETKSRTPEILSFVVTFGFFGVLAYMLTMESKPGESLLIMLGSLGTAWAAIVNFWFGSTAGSSRKTELLSQAPAVIKNESK
jgi:hypothetical protein